MVCPQAFREPVISVREDQCVKASARSKLTRWTRYMMLMPRVMNGLEKSMTFSRSAVMVSPATARSAFCNTETRDGNTESDKDWHGTCDRTNLVLGKMTTGDQDYSLLIP